MVFRSTASQSDSLCAESHYLRDPHHTTHHEQPPSTRRGTKQCNQPTQPTNQQLPYSPAASFRLYWYSLWLGDTILCNDNGDCLQDITVATMTNNKTMKFSSQQYLHALAPIDNVIDAFIEEENTRLSSMNITDAWSIQSQGRFAALIASSPDASPDLINAELEVQFDDIEYLPSEKYVAKLVKRYTTRLEAEGKELEDDNLASLVCHFSMARISKLPDPADSCLLTYRVPLVEKERGRDKYDLLGIRIYPQHNDVGVAKVWEAGACLAEYLIQHSNCVRGRRVIELGAGVGLTGLIAAAIGAESVHMTDYTDATLENLSYNVSINNKWLEDRGIDTDVVSVGNLEWGEYAEHDCCSHPAEVLIAADVVYTVECIPDLVATVSKFLSSGSAKVAVFATTYRNRSTFALFERELEKKRITCAYKSQDEMPYVFPCYFNQPRSDVRICIMSRSE